MAQDRPVTDPWEIRPLEGLGPFVFGMSPEAALRHAAAYGGVEADYQSSPDSAEQIFEKQAPRIGEDAARDLVAEILASGADLRYRRTIAFPSSLALTFLEDELEDILVAGEATEVHVAGLRLFGKDVDPMPALRALQARNGEPPLLLGENCVFRRLHVTAHEMITVAADGSIAARRKGRRRYWARTLSWRLTPVDPDEDFCCYRPVDLGA
jgi:hypothetical protein